MSNQAPAFVAIALAMSAFAGLGCSGNAQVAGREHLARAAAYSADKKYPEAVIELRRAVQLEPTNGEARRRLAATYTQLAEWANASRESVHAADLLPTDIEAQLRAAELLIIVGRFQDARGRADRALAIEPGNVRAQLLKGHSAAGLRELDSAIVAVEQAVGLDPDRGLSYANLGQLQWAKGDKDAAADAFAKAVAIDPNSVPAHLARANFEWASSDAAAAEASLRQVLRLEPSHLPAHRAMALLLMATGRVPEAGPHLELVAQSSGEGRARLVLADFYVLSGRTDEATVLLGQLGDAVDEQLRTPARLRLAMLAGRGGKPLEAARMIDTLAQEEPANARALTAQAELRYAAGDTENALRSSMAAVTADPRLARAHFVHGQVLLALGRVDDAVSALAEAAQLDTLSGDPQLALARIYLARNQAAPALSLAQEAAERQPLNLQARVVLAKALMAGHDLDGAQRVIETLERSRQPTAAVHTTRAMLEVARKRPPAARRALERALALAPTDIDALSMLTTLGIGTNRSPDAVARVAAAAAQPQPSANLLLLAARTQAAAGNVKEAERLARQLLAAQPSSPASYQLMGEIYASAGRLAEAQQEFEQIIRLDPQSVMAHTMVGILLQMQDRSADAEKPYQSAMQADPRRAGVAANNLAWLIAERSGNLDLALQYAQVAVAALPDSGGPLDTLGWIYHRKGMSERAIVALLDAVNKEPRSARFHYHLGLAYAGGGDSRLARRALEQALLLQPDFNGSSDARAVLGRLAPGQ